MTESTVHVPAETEPATANPRRSSEALWLVLPAASGVVVGILWWILAPGGLNLLSGNPALANPANPDSWLPRDLVLAGLMLVAGCVTGLLLDGKLQGAGAGRRFAFALVGGAAGAVVAWLLGLLAAQLWGTAPDPSQGTDSGFTLRSYAVLVLWPGAIAFVTFVLALFGVLSGKPVK
ncbi:hypothetical protein [Arthrobacter sp. StoSoilB5]|uniref:hypothetical protein n=1 Tax=Arthrobacter sp. StoSoilB5 TaxID=2830992 RepID=UPI001CC48240|nr:hypothetical protein [Arthrobacter sp. StoSoilB5]